MVGVSVSGGGSGSFAGGGLHEPMVTAKLADVATAALSTFVVATADGCLGTTSGT